MQARPILMIGPMALATNEGRKTQTRRVVKPQPPNGTEGVVYEPSHFAPDRGWYFYPNGGHVDCPYGRPGDLLWVRETWGAHFIWDDAPGYDDNPDGACIWYRADGTCLGGCEESQRGERWRPSIHMPRWASRLTLRITDVRVERVQEIARGDCMSEGCPFPNLNGDVGKTDPRGWFSDLWDSLNAARGCPWSANPWVWVIEYETIHQNVDAVLAREAA